MPTTMATGTDEFDPEDMNCWYFGLMSRDSTNNLLNPQDNGVFLVRDSATIRGDLVLCVKEDSKVSHYIINKIQVAGGTQLRIGDQQFPSLSTLLSFYKTHYLDTTPLVRPVAKFKAKYDFAGRDPDDLPFVKGEGLFVVRKDEPQWWTAMNNRGETGSVPVPYIEPYTGEDVSGSTPITPSPEVQSSQSHTTVNNSSLPRPVPKPTLPAQALVIKDRIPNAYDTKALKFQKGEVVTVIAMHVDGQWEGEIKDNSTGNVRKGFFPFNYVKFVEGDETENSHDIDNV